MTTISLCMIVKNEEDILARCLDSIADLMDEIIIVDTGSTDATKEIAARYTDKIFDFEWTYDFAEARNYSFSKATMEYIYCADADEVLNDFNREKFKTLKAAMLPEVEIVQMKYITPDKYNTVMNIRDEYRPKLYKRERKFTWIDPIHETIRLKPVVFNSEIEILHMPRALHSKRDFKIFIDTFEKEGELSTKLYNMFAKELYISGTVEDLEQSLPIFERTLNDEDAPVERLEQAFCIYSRWARQTGRDFEFAKYALRAAVHFPCAEIFFELGNYFFDKKEAVEAAHWFEQASSIPAILDVHTGGDKALYGAAESLNMLAKQIKADPDYDRAYQASLVNSARRYEAKAKSWRMPSENEHHEL